MGVGVGASQRIPLSVLARNPHKGLAREISHETRRGRGKEGPRAVKRGRQSTEVDRPRQRTAKSSQENREFDRREQSTEVGGGLLQGPVDSKAGLANVQG